MSLCSYGCGNQGIYELKNGKFCCHKSCNGCSINKQKNSANHSVKSNNNLLGVIGIPNNNCTCRFCTKEINFVGVQNHEKYCNLNPTNIKIVSCECCGVCNDGLYGSGRFCSLHCARSFGACVNKLERALKISKTLTKVPLELICKNCNKIFYRKRVRQACSRECQYALRNKSIETRQKLSKAMKLRWEEGRHSGWASRNKLTPSYAEKYFMTVLMNAKIKFVFEKKAGRYFIDFALSKGRIALEIDGSQHKWPDRKKKDQKKDEYLVSKRWRVLRIPWCGRLSVRKSANMFFEEYNKLMGTDLKPMVFS